MALDPTVRAALAAQSLRVFHAVQIVFNATGTKVNLIDGSGFVTFPVDGTPTYFDGNDEIFGSLAGITAIKEEVATESPVCSVTLMPHSKDAFGEINQPEQQGSPVRIWWGLVNDETGMVLGTPELLWAGRLDTCKSNVNEGSLVVEIETVSGFDRLFDVNEGECLNQTWHQSIWPGETALNWNVASTVEPFWGADAPRPAITPAGFYGGAGTTGGYGGLIGSLIGRVANQ